MWSPPCVVTFYVDLKSKMATLASDWLTHFQLFLKNGYRDLPVLQMAQMFIAGSRLSVVNFFVEQKSKMTAIDNLNKCCYF